MAKYRITSPDGGTFEVTAPDDATEQQVMDYVKANAGTAPRGNRTSTATAALEGVAQGLTFGFADELEAGAKAAVGSLAAPFTGEQRSIGEIYDESVGNARDRANAAADEHPVAFYGGEIGSSLLVPGGLSRLGVRGAAHVAEGLAPRMLAGAREGAAYGAAYGAGKSEGDLLDRAAGAAGGAALGGTIGAAAPAVIDAAASAARPVVNSVRAITRPQAEAGRRVTEAMDADIAMHTARNLPPNELARNQTAARLINEGRAGDDLRNMDVGGENIRALARSAANNSPEAREVLQDSINRRYEGQSGRAVDFIRGLITSPGNAPQTREALRDAARRSRTPLYRRAYEDGDTSIWSPELEQLASSPHFVDAMRGAVTKGKTRAVVEGFGGFNPGVTISDTGVVTFRRGESGVPTYPNLQYWDYVKRELDDTARAAFRAGRNEEGAAVSQLSQSLRDELDRQVPTYERARGVAAQYFRADDAVEAGEVFARGQTPAHTARRAIDRMAPAEREAFQEGFVSELIQRLERTPDRQSILGRMAQSRAERERIEVALGPERARELEAFLYLERVMDLPRSAMGNSTTARQLVELGLAGGTGMLASGGNPFDPRAWAVGALTYGAQRGRARVNQNMARNIAQMLVSGDEAAYRAAARQVARGPGLDALRRLVGDLGQPATNASAGLVGGTVMAQDATQRLENFQGDY